MRICYRTIHQAFDFIGLVRISRSNVWLHHQPKLLLQLAIFGSVILTVGIPNLMLRGYKLQPSQNLYSYIQIYPVRPWPTVYRFDSKITCAT